MVVAGSAEGQAGNGPLRRMARPACGQLCRERQCRRLLDGSRVWWAVELSFKDTKLPDRHWLLDECG